MARRLALSLIPLFVAVCLLCAVPCASADPANQGGDPAAAPAASEVSLPNAPCGDALAWSFDSASGALTVSGSGPMYDWASSEDVPWRAIRDQVTSVVVGEGVTAVGDRAFFGMRYLASVSLPSTVASIGEGAFGNALPTWGRSWCRRCCASIGTDGLRDVRAGTSVATANSVADGDGRPEPAPDPGRWSAVRRGPRLDVPRLRPACVGFDPLGRAADRHARVLWLHQPAARLHPRKRREDRRLRLLRRGLLDGHGVLRRHARGVADAVRPGGERRHRLRRHRVRGSGPGHRREHRGGLRRACRLRLPHRHGCRHSTRHRPPMRTRSRPCTTWAAFM